ncbi:MAG: phage tail assembly protein [Magnetovibrionaceae bacterium]
MAKTKTVDLTQPILVEGKETSELTFQRPKLKHLKKLPLDDLTGDGLIVLIAALANITPKEAGEIDMADMDAISEVITDFLPKKALAGATL